VEAGGEGRAGRSAPGKQYGRKVGAQFNAEEKKGVFRTRGKGAVEFVCDMGKNTMSAKSQRSLRGNPNGIDVFR